MAKQGKRISDKSKEKIRLKYEAGLLSIKDIAKQHNLTREAVTRMAKREGWERGKITQKVTTKVTKKATEKLIEKEGDKLFDYTSEYIDNIKNLDKAHKANLGSYVQALKESNNNISKAEADKFKTAQQFLKLSAETFKINFEGIRLAMGLDKDRKDKQPIINIINFADADDDTL